MTVSIYSPSDGSLIAEREHASDEYVSDVLANAYDAQKQWQKLSVTDRADYCHKAIAWFVEHQDEIAEEISQLMGRPIQYAKGEISGLKERADYMIGIAQSALSDTIISPDDKEFTRIIRPTALGTAFIIAPWNYPYLTAINSIIPALMAGNCVILKHASQTLLCAERFQQAFKAAGLPSGVFQYLHLSHEQTLSAIQADDINYVSFTGSVNAGKIIEQSLAGYFKPLALELGGKDAAYVRADADLKSVVANLVEGSFFNSGQSCCGIERIYVDTSIFEEFVSQFVDETKQWVVGHALNPATSLGPMINSKAITHAQTQIDQALLLGATTHINEHDFTLVQAPSQEQNLKQGQFMLPQVLTQVNHDMDLMREESFAPIIGIMAVDNDKQAIALINDSAYGLSASIWGQDEEACLALCNDINTGTVFINRCDYLDPSLPWVGVKDSGRGCSLSHLAYQQLTRPKSIHLKKRK
jgi:acyl-CoA reductase-like NAD-dependent aldehyde dehydrogenase